MNWLNRDQLIILPRIFLVFYLLFGAALVFSALHSRTGLLDFFNRPLGADFSQFWVASSLTLKGNSAAVYDFPKFVAAQKAAFQVDFPFPWVYPPTYLLVVYPLGLLPYLASLSAWLAVTISPYLALLRRLAPHPATLWLALAFPGTFENLLHGQNGFLTTALIGWGLLLLDHSPLAGGFLLGLVSLKPHLMVLVPLALVAGRRWKALAALLGSASILGVISLLAFGGEVWLAFLKNLMFPMKLVATGAMPVSKMITPFAAFLMAGAPFSVALALQAGVMAAVAFGVYWIWRRDLPLALRGSALVLGLLLFTPHAFPYDLALLALPLAWLGWQGFSRGCTPAEQVLLSLAWLIPILAPLLGRVRVQLAPLILAGLFVLVLQKGKMRPPRAQAILG
jgi:hypothetical protein